jgi:SRSO17 transposase
MIDNAIEEGIPFSYVTMDGFYGENPELLTELESRGLLFDHKKENDKLTSIFITIK